VRADVQEATESVIYGVNRTHDHNSTSQVVGRLERMKDSPVKAKLGGMRGARWRIVRVLPDGAIVSPLCSWQTLESAAPGDGSRKGLGAGAYSCLENLPLHSLALAFKGKRVVFDATTDAIEVEKGEPSVRFDGHTTAADDYPAWPLDRHPAAPRGSSRSVEAWAPGGVPFTGQTTAGADYRPFSSDAASQARPPPSSAGRHAQTQTAAAPFGDARTTAQAAYVPHPLDSAAAAAAAAAAANRRGAGLGSPYRRQSKLKFDSTSTARDAYQHYPGDHTRLPTCRGSDANGATRGGGPFEGTTESRSVYCRHPLPANSGGGGGGGGSASVWAPNAAPFDGTTTAGEAYVPHRVSADQRVRPARPAAHALQVGGAC
jgi:hypothetical protein